MLYLVLLKLLNLISSFQGLLNGGLLNVGLLYETLSLVVSQHVIVLNQVVVLSSLSYMEHSNEALSFLAIGIQLSMI